MMNYELRVWPTLCLVLLLLMGCSSPAPTPTPAVGPTATEAATPGPTPTPLPPATPTPDLSSGRLVLWHSWAEADGDALTQMLAAFQQQHPGLQVDTLFVAYNDLPQSYADAVHAGGGPDLILAPNWWLSDMVAAEVVLPLDNLVTSGDLNEYWPATTDNLRRNGQLYGLPTHFELVSLFYNRALIPQAQLPKSTDDLLKLAQADPHQGMGLYASLYHLYWGFAGYGAQLINGQGQVILDQSDGAANFLTWLATLKKTPGSFVDPDYGMLLDRFKKGEFAFFVDGPWAIADLHNALGDNLGITLLPAGPVAPAQPWLSADGVFLNPHSAPDQQQRALLLAKHLTNAASGGVLAQVAHHLPASRDAQVGGDALIQGFLQQAAQAQSMPTNAEMKNVWGYGGDMLVKVLNNVGDPKSVIKETTTLINEANGK